MLAILYPTNFYHSVIVATIILLTISFGYIVFITKDYFIKKCVLHLCFPVHQIFRILVAINEKEARSMIVMEKATHHRLVKKGIL